jgi:hypothetical protein
MIERTGSLDRWAELVRDLSILKLLLLSKESVGNVNNTKWASFLGLRTNPRYLAHLPGNGVKDPLPENVKIWLESEYCLADLYFRSNFKECAGSLRLDEVVRLWAVFSDSAPHFCGSLSVLYLLRSWIGKEFNEL